MAPPTATETVSERQDTLMKMDTTVMEEEQASHLAELTRGNNKLTGIPKFPSFHEHRKHILLHMAAVFRLWARNKYTEGISGHISVRDPEHDGLMWMNPIGKHFGLMNASDMVCLRISDGEVVGGNRARPVNNPGYYIHSEVHKARHNINAVCHAHTIAGRAWCAFGKPLDMITQDVCTFSGVLAVDTDYAGIATAEEEGRKIAKALGPQGKVALLLNHGLITVGSTVDEASFLFGLLDRSCEIQLKVEAACRGNPGLEKRIIPEELVRKNSVVASGKDWLYEEGQPDIQYEIEAAGDVISAGLDDVTVDAV